MKYYDIKARARELRKNQTPEERVLWEYLRKHKLQGFKFLRQHPIIYESNKNEHFFFIPDFYCAKAKLIVELDGEIHKKTIEYDINRDLILKSMGLKILRIKNSELKDITTVLRKIEDAMKK